MADAFEDRLRAAVRSRTPELQQAAEHILDAGGKRLRPRFTLLVAEAVGAPAEDAAAVAVAAELLHTATLVHDDVLDAADRRRHRPSVHVRFGLPLAILTGDYLLACGFQQLAAVPAAAGPWAAALRELAEAEALQAACAFRLDTSLETSRAVAAGKTGALFAWCGRAVAHAAGAGGEVVSAAGRLGRSFGYAFQLADDLGDIARGDRGKPPRLDLRRGQLTVPVQLARRAEPALDDLLARAFASRSEGDFEATYAALEAPAAAAGVGERERARSAVLSDAGALSQNPAFSVQLGAMLDVS